MSAKSLPSWSTVGAVPPLGSRVPAESLKTLVSLTCVMDHCNNFCVSSAILDMCVCVCLRVSACVWGGVGLVEEAI